MKGNILFKTAALKDLASIPLFLILFVVALVFAGACWVAEEIGVLS